MSKNTSIEWTESTWNPITGCTKISDGCKHCYAERMAKRLKAMDNIRYQNEFELTVHHDIFKRPLSWKKPKCIFVNSMSDLFHEDLKKKYIIELFEVMNEASWHIFQILTKRSNKLLQLSDELKWSENIWQGVTVESDKYLDRIEDLKQTDAKVKFISFEPLISDIPKVDLSGIDWVIVGGESGPGARKLEKDWVINLKNQCKKQNIPFFFKQWGGVNKKKNGRKLNGKLYSEYPQQIELLEKAIRAY